MWYRGKSGSYFVTRLQYSHVVPSQDFSMWYHRRTLNRMPRQNFASAWVKLGYLSREEGAKLISVDESVVTQALDWLNEDLRDAAFPTVTKPR